MECVCGHKNKNVGKCIGGEVGGFKHLHVETKQPNRVSWTSPCHQDVRAECKDKPEMCFRAVFYYTKILVTA